MSHIRITNPPKNKMPWWAWAMLVLQVGTCVLAMVR